MVHLESFEKWILDVWIAVGWCILNLSKDRFLMFLASAFIISGLWVSTDGREGVRLNVCSHPGGSVYTKLHTRSSDRLMTCVGSSMFSRVVSALCTLNSIRKRNKKTKEVVCTRSSVHCTVAVVQSCR